MITKSVLTKLRRPREKVGEEVNRDNYSKLDLGIMTFVEYIEREKWTSAEVSPETWASGTQSKQY